MKKVFAILLALCLFLSMAACRQSETEGTSQTTNTPETSEATNTPEPEKMVTLYVVTEQKNYTNGELSGSATFEYDDHGRPLLVEFQRADGYGRRSKLQYDQYGNRTQEICGFKSAGAEQFEEYPIDYSLTYTDGLLTHIEGIRNDGTSYWMDIHYDADNRLVLAEFEPLIPGSPGDVWQSFTYDKDGKLIQETLCTYEGLSGYYRYARVCYSYDDQGRLTEQCFLRARSDKCLSSEEAEGLEYQLSPLEHFFFYYDQEGKLAYIGEGEEDTYPGGSAAIYSNPNYTFDENGNLVRAQHGEGSWVEYSYTKIEVTEADAVMARRLMHAIANNIQFYTADATMDPLFLELCPGVLYRYHLCSVYFYYLIPYPQFEILSY